MSHVLLFGASGFLGAHVRDALRQRPVIDQVTCLGRDSYDLNTVTTDQLSAALRKLRPAAVVNCTGRIDGSTAELVQSNTVVTATIIDAIAAVDPSIRFVRLGSASEYGPVPHGRAVTESDPARPAGDYGRSHLAATTLTEDAAAQGRADGISLRVFNPIGAGVHDNTLLGRAAGRIRHALAIGTPSITLGPLSAYRDFVDVRDVAAAVVAATLAPQLTQRVINVGSGRAVTAREAVEALARTAGYHGEIIEEGAPIARSAAVDWIMADISRATDLLRWRPGYDLTDSTKAIWADGAGTDAR
jgi:NDP-hexose 4-ketoreductase